LYSLKELRILEMVGLITEWLRGDELEKRTKAGDLGGTMRASEK